MKRWIAFKLLFLLVLPFGKAQKRNNTSQTGSASYYADRFHGKKTSSGEAFNMNGLTAAHPTLPFGSLVRVTNLSNGTNLVVRINDRGPHCKKRIIDVSKAAARRLGLLGAGSTKVRVSLISLPKNGQPDYAAVVDEGWQEVGKTQYLELPAFKSGASYSSEGVRKKLSGYGMQVASYHDPESALYELNAMKKAGFKEVFLQVPKTDDDTVYRVVVGQFADRAKALSMQDKLERVGYKGIPLRHI